MSQNTQKYQTPAQQIANLCRAHNLAKIAEENTTNKSAFIHDPDVSGSSGSYSFFLGGGGRIRIGQAQPGSALRSGTCRSEGRGPGAPQSHRRSSILWLK